MKGKIHIQEERVVPTGKEFLSSKRSMIKKEIVERVTERVSSVGFIRTNQLINFRISVYVLPYSLLFYNKMFTVYIHKDV